MMISKESSLPSEKPLNPPCSLRVTVDPESQAAKMDEAEEEALHLKSLAESRYKESNLKSALKYAKRAHRLSPNLDGVASMVTAFEILRSAHKRNWYKILQVEPFAHINTIKTKYKKLALLLHPDKNPHLGSDEAFKLVGEAFSLLSDRIRRKEYDMKLRIKMKGSGFGDTFWTACSTCRLLHQFERRYLGHQLVCPSCNKSFEALEVEDGDNGAGVRSGVESDGRRRLRKRMSSVGEVLERCETKKPKVDEEMMTLAQLQMEIKQRKAQEVKMKSKDKNTKEKDKDNDRQNKGKSSEVERLAVLKKGKNSQVLKKGKDLENGKSKKSKGAESEDLEEADDSQFHVFKKDKRSFKKGQVWAMYDDNDGMPRNYGLVDQVVSITPFEVKLSWLDLQNNGDQWLASCGRFKVASQTTANSVHIFSHLVDCDRAAREIYRIYPNKGSVWALYNKAAFDDDGRNLLVKEKRCYDIVVFLTSYSEMHGLSMGYLEKVYGFKTVFKRREIGAHAIRCLEKDDVRLMSHEIPAKKLSGDEAPNLPKDCWELDPASLPLDLLTFG